MHAVTFHAVDTQMKCMHKQGVGERSEPHALLLLLYVRYWYIYVTTWFSPPKSEAQTQLPAWVMVDYTILWTYPQDLQILHLTATCIYANSMFQCLFSSPVFGEILQVLELSETQGNNGKLK